MSLIVEADILGKHLTVYCTCIIKLHLQLYESNNQFNNKKNFTYLEMLK